MNKETENKIRYIARAGVRIRSAAAAYTGLDHDSCYTAAREDQGMFRMEDAEEGFVTGDGEFVSRKEAFQIANAAGQLKYTPEPGTEVLASYMIDWGKTFDRFGVAFREQKREGGE